MSAPKRSLASISCIIQVSEESKSAALPLAAAVSEASGAHLGVTVIAPKAHIPYSFIASSYVAAMAADLNKRTLSVAETAAAGANETIKKQGLSGHVVVEHALLDDAASLAVRAARTSELIVVEQPAASLDLKSMILEEALFHSGHPVLVASPHSPPVGAFERIVIGWDGSQHAARAVADALSLFPSITHADIVVVMAKSRSIKCSPELSLLIISPERASKLGWSRPKLFTNPSPRCWTSTQLTMVPTSS